MENERRYPSTSKGSREKTGESQGKKEKNKTEGRYQQEWSLDCIPDVAI
jgi:hypothetical protein